MSSQAEKDHEKHLVPRDLDAPVPIMFWEPVEVIGALSIVGFMIMFHQLLLGFALAAVFLWITKKLKKRSAKAGLAMHMLHAQGVPIDGSLHKHMPPARLPEFID